MPEPARFAIYVGAWSAGFWICSSLLVSHYVYDRSGLYSMAWLPGCLPKAPQRWLYLHNGLNEAATGIRCLFPESEGQFIDVYDPCKMSEPSIRRARDLAGLPAVGQPHEPLPVPDAQFDTIFLVFTAHEFRDPGDRARFFREVARVLEPGGHVVLVEHLRDWANFFAFGPGFLHFFSRRVWERAAHAAALTTVRQAKVTAFVHVFLLQKQ